MALADKLKKMSLKDIFETYREYGDVLKDLIRPKED